jgi:hypothetical protein
MSGRAADRLAKLIDSRSGRIAFEASKLCLAYAWGAPRMTVEIGGAFGDLSRELAEALKQARERRAAFEAGQDVASLHTLPPGSVASSSGEAPALEADLVVKAGTEREP